MSGVAEDAAFSRAVDRFRAGLTREQRQQFAGCNKTEVEKAIADIQTHHGSQRRQKNLKRVAKFIEGMSQLGHVIEVFLNVEVSVAFIWGPIKFVLQTASTWVETLDLLLDTYAEIGETLPSLSQYGELFKHHPSVGKQLENYYCDVLDFNKCALEVFSRPCWKAIFHSTWRTFKTNFGPILTSFGRHKTLLSEEKLTALMSEVQSNFQQLRTDLSLRDAQDQARILAEVKERRRQQRREIREGLNATDSHQDQEDSFAVLQGSSSGGWIAGDPTLKAWSDPLSTQSSFIFLNGIPGAGKTTLTSGIVDHLLKLKKKAELRGNKILVAYFYFKYMHEDKRSPQKMLSSILSQLVSQDPSLLDHVYNEIGGTSNIGVRLLKELAQLAIRTARLCFLVVDGLDECFIDKTSTTSGALDVINWLIDLTTPSSSAQSSDIRILVSSRRDGVIEKELRDYPTLRLENLQPHDNDIERFVRMQARVISETFPESEATDEDKIVEKITTAAKGMFLYAKVVLDNLLEQETAFDFAAELEEKNFPKGLEEAYDRIVCRVLKASNETKASKESKQHIAKEILGYVVCAHRPLRWREIQSLFCIDPKAGTADMTRRPVRSCKHYCSSLVDAIGWKGDTNDPEGRVELVHVSAKRYLINIEAVCLATEHARMALFTSRYLASRPFDLKAFEDIQNYALSGYYNIHDYAVTSWWHHTHEAIAHSSSLPADLSLEMIHSLFAHLQFRLEVQTGEVSDLPTPDDIVAQFRQLSTYNRAREDLGNLSARIRGIRAVVETIWTLMAHNTDVQKSLGLKLYGPKQYKCFNSWCYRFSDGFEGSKQRDDHMNQHIRPFRCSVDGCFVGALGFKSKEELRRHVSRYHREPEKIRFPIPSQPRKYQDTAAAICAGDLEAVKGMIRRFIEVTGTFDFAKPIESIRALKTWTALTLAVESKHFDICQYLLEEGASANSQDLHAAIGQNDADILRLLISHISSAELANLDPGSLFSVVTGRVDTDAQTTFLKAVEFYHPRFKFSDLFLQNAMAQDLLEIVKYCLACGDDMIMRRLQANYHNWMKHIMAASQECLQVLLSSDRSGALTKQLLLKAHGDGNETMLSRLPSLTPEISEWIEFQWHRDRFANDETCELSTPLKLIISKLRPNNIWDLLGVSFCFYPLDTRLRKMHRDFLREVLSFDNSLCFQKDQKGATLLHEIIGEGNVEMVEFITSVPGVDLNATYRPQDSSDGVTPLSLAMSRMAYAEDSVSLKWVKIVYTFLSTDGADISKITVEDEFAWLMVAASSDDQELQHVVEKGLSLFCPTATANAIQRLMQRLPALRTVLSFSPVEEQKRRFCLTNLIANPNVLDCLVRHGDITNAAKLLLSHESESYSLTPAERLDFVNLAIQVDDDLLLKRLLTNDEIVKVTVFLVAARGSPNLFHTLFTTQANVEFDTTNGDGLTPLEVARLNNNEAAAEWLRSWMSEQYWIGTGTGLQEWT